jgi:uncharacterized protein
MSVTPETRQKLDTLKALLAACDSAAIAFSGGVDSTFLVAVARDAVPGRVVAITVAAPMTPDREIRESYRIAKDLGVEQIVTGASDIIDIEVFRENPPDRCYHCKLHFFAVILDAADEVGLECVMEASNADDVEDYRPGLKAVEELGVMSPLLEAGLTKTEIRALSEEMGLPTWDKPSMACLASRVPYGEPVTLEKLEQIEKGEQILVAEGFRLCRLRHHGSFARVEVPLEDIERLSRESVWARIAVALLELGFERVEIDPKGYRTGSLNEALDREGR